MSKAGILIVEDSYIVAIHLQKTLEMEGYEVIGIASSGEAAIVAIQNNKPALVLMDIMLSGKLDGIETARAIKSRFNIPVIYITALSDKETIQRAKITEPYGYLTKPFEDRQIFTLIEMALYKHAIEMKLKQSEQKFFSTVKSISDAVIIIDAQFKIIYMNPRAETITEWDLKTVQSRSILDIFILRDSSTDEFPVNPFQCSLQREKNSSLPPNLLLMSKRGEERPIGEGSLSPITNEQGKFIGMVVIFKDLSDKIEHDKLKREFEKRHVAALLEGQEKERSRIAKDLHDGLGQTLNAIKMNVNLVSNSEEKFGTLTHLIDEAIQESIKISENLLPAKLKDFDLATCLRSLCGNIEKTSKIPVSFQSYGNHIEIDQSQKINFYRIAQEAINNSLKHSDASVINVQLNFDQDQLQLMIEDDGKGFVKEKIYDESKHHGLVNMRERAEIMGGKFTIESDRSRGTLIIVEAPVKLTTIHIYAKA